MSGAASDARPVCVLTGALGAGKTSLLNAALARGLLGRVAVVVNEFGAVSIDHELVQRSTDDVVLLPGGCLCCAVRSDLAEALARLQRAAAHDEGRDFERVLIETSGLAEPGPILQLFTESPVLARRFRLDAVVTLVDALLGANTLGEEGTALRQVALADRVLLTKWEDAPDLAGLDARLTELNPFAARGRVSLAAPRSEWFRSVSPRPLRVVPAGAMHAAHDEAIEAFALTWDEPRALHEVGDWLHDLAERFGARLMRVKGIVQARDAEQAVAVHAVQHLVAAPRPLPAAETSHTRRGVRDSRVVFIVRGLEPRDVHPPWAVTISDG